MDMNGWKKVKYSGVECLVYEGFPENTNIEGYPHLYWLRHPDDDWSEPCTIEPYVLVNRWGALLSPKELVIGRKGNLSLSKEIRERFAGVMQ